MHILNAITTRKVVLAQVCYLILAYSYNLISIQQISQGTTPLLKGNPQLSLLLLLPFVVVTCVGLFRKMRGVYFLSITCSVALFVMGVLPHCQVFFNESYFTLYVSKAAWLSAMLINVFGVVCYFTGAKHAKRLIQSNASNGQYLPPRKFL